jgi:hypothetical protein
VTNELQQLDRVIDDPLSGRARLPDVDAGKVQHFWPVLVTYGDLLAAEPLFGNIDSKVRSIFHSRRHGPSPCWASRMSRWRWGWSPPGRDSSTSSTRDGWRVSKPPVLWLPIPGMTQHNHHEPIAISDTEGLEGLLLKREDLGLHPPYGYRARRLGIGPVRVPQPEGVKVTAPDPRGPTPTEGQRKGRGGRPRPLTPLPTTCRHCPTGSMSLSGQLQRIAPRSPGRRAPPAPTCLSTPRRTPRQMRARVP